MAFSTQQAGRARVAIVIIALVVVAGIAVAVFSGAFSPATQATSGDAASTTSAEGDASSGDALEEIDAQYGTATNSLLSQYEADPSNPSALLNVANGYFDWGVAVMNHAASDEDSARATELLNDAIGYYDTYLESSPEAKAVVVDRAICRFYTGDTDTAIAELEALTSDNSDSFAPAWANLGMFYEAAGRVDDARSAYEAAIDAAGDADAYNVKSYAQERLDALQDS